MREWQLKAFQHLEHSEWLLARVRPLVEGEAREAVEGLAALHALEWLVAAVDLLVHCERGVAGEGLATPALVWLLAGVDAEVVSEVPALVEGLATLAARIRPLPGVHAGSALIGPLARVDAVVHAER